MYPKFNLSRDKKDCLSCFNWKDDYCFLQFHSSIELCMVDEGEIEMTIDGKRNLMKKGDIAVILSFSSHAYKTPSHSVTSNLFIPTRMCEEFMAATENKRLTSPYISNEKAYNTIKKYFSLLQEENINSIMQAGYVYVILGTILENTVLEDSTLPKDPELITKILFYIGENYKNDISPIKIAKHFGYTQSHISRYFKACCGITPGRYITITRLRQAIMMMYEGHNITYCIMESGFSSNAAFYRSFKKEFGCSPKEYILKTNTL
ncbi:MAG: AraC family transcriptional regulator [Ruminococcaceae bacterium]|nr:AraC family transcriptional regulator [Oscillospiraceae bacterium]